MELRPPLLLHLCALTAPTFQLSLSSLLATSGSLLRIQCDMLAAQSFCTLLMPARSSIHLCCPDFGSDLLPSHSMHPSSPAATTLPPNPARATPAANPAVPSCHPNALSLLLADTLNSVPGGGVELDVPHTACVGQVQGLHAGPLVAEWAGRSPPTCCSCLGPCAHVLGGSPSLHDWDVLGKRLDGTQDLRTGMAIGLPAEACVEERAGELALKAAWT